MRRREKCKRLHVVCYWFAGYRLPKLYNYMVLVTLVQAHKALNKVFCSFSKIASNSRGGVLKGKWYGSNVP